MDRGGLRRVSRLLLLGAAGAGAGCRPDVGKAPPDGAASPQAALTVDAGPPATRLPGAPTRTADLPRLPEDPAAGQRSQAQWRAHMEHEERERQLAFDKRKLAEHRALVARLRDARARLDGATTAAAVTRLAGPTSSAIADARRRIRRLDHWGVNSRLLGDYDELLKILDGPYAAARVAALAGNPAPLGQARSRWDAHLKVIDGWLAEAAGADDDP